MKSAQLRTGFALLLVSGTVVFSQEFTIKNIVSGLTDPISNETIAFYDFGISKGIIDPKKYTIESFDRDERNIFKPLYEKYISMNGSQPIDYQKWLVMNNFGLLPDTQESLFRPKLTKRSTADNLNLFINTVRKGDILISGYSNGGLNGHAALMTTDYWVLEMRGGSRWMEGIPSNNRQLGKDTWYRKYNSKWITVYRCPNNEIARDAAVWADLNYHNPSGGGDKTIHITYYLTDDLLEIDPSYDSKLVLQAYYYGSGRHKVVKNLARIDYVVFPSNIPKLFKKKYRLINEGEF